MGRGSMGHGMVMRMLFAMLDIDSASKKRGRSMSYLFSASRNRLAAFNGGAPPLNHIAKLLDRRVLS